MRDLEWWHAKARTFPPKECIHCHHENTHAEYFPVNREGQVIAYKCVYCGEEEVVVSKPHSSPIRYHLKDGILRRVK